MNKLKFLVLIAFLMPSIIKPFVSCYLMEKDGKYVLLLGDLHNSQINDLNEIHFNKLKDIIGKFNNSNKINAFVELFQCNSELYKIKKNVKKLPYGQYLGAVTFDKFAEELENPKFFKIIPSDIRKSEYSILFKTIKIIQVILFSKIINPEQLNEKFDFNELVTKYQASGNMDYSLNE
ncbi:MAG: hypothetical protein P4L22_03370, partial [Candidatus Babeliales bacterium]|nr:hypothetical protein [Candidatus Babeliales bacterium]